MCRLSQVLLTTVLVAFMMNLLAQSPKPNPCQQRLERIAKEMTRLWRDLVKGKTLQETKSKQEFENLLKSEIKEPFACPVLNTPYLFLPEELSKQWGVPVILADPEPHPDKLRFAVIALFDPTGKGKEQFIATSLPPPRELYQRLKQSSAQARLKAQAAVCLSNLRNVGLALAMYIQDYDERLPPMKIGAQTQKVLYPYLPNPSVFNCPITMKPYQPNPHLHLRRLKEISKPNEVPAFYDTQPHPDGMRGIVFVDGHVKILPLKDWQLLQKRYKLPVPK